MNKQCQTCGNPFTPSQKAPWATECLDCWKKKSGTFNTVNTPKPRGQTHDRRAFAMAYAKDLVVAGKIEIGQLSAYAQKMLEWMNQDITNEPPF